VREGSLTNVDMFVWNKTHKLKQFLYISPPRLHANLAEAKYKTCNVDIQIEFTVSRDSIEFIYLLW
jgi:hypothetical protein